MDCGRYNYNSWMFMGFINQLTLWKFHIAIENGNLIVDLPILMEIFHSYVRFPEGFLLGAPLIPVDHHPH